jgi:preprotein translocase subunit SecD
MIVFVASLSSCRKSLEPLPAVLEFAMEIGPAPAALELDYATPGNEPEHLQLEEPIQFRVTKAEPLRGSAGEREISVTFEKDEARRFHDWTAARVGRRVAIMVNRRVCICATIAMPLSGMTIVDVGAAGYTPEEVRRIALGLVHQD